MMMLITLSKYITFICVIIYLYFIRIQLKIFNVYKCMNMLMLIRILVIFNSYSHVFTDFIYSNQFIVYMIQE